MQELHIPSIHFKKEASIQENIQSWIKKIFPDHTNPGPHRNCADCTCAILKVLMGKPLETLKAKPIWQLTTQPIITKKQVTQSYLSSKDGDVQLFLDTFIANKSSEDLQPQDLMGVQVEEVRLALKKTTRENLAATLLTMAPRNKEESGNAYCAEGSGFGFVVLTLKAKRNQSKGAQPEGHILAYYITADEKVFFLDAQSGEILKEISNTNYHENAFWHETRPSVGFLPTVKKELTDEKETKEKKLIQPPSSVFPAGLMDPSLFDLPFTSSLPPDSSLNYSGYFDPSNFFPNKNYSQLTAMPVEAKMNTTTSLITSVTGNLPPNIGVLIAEPHSTDSSDHKKAEQAKNDFNVAHPALNNNPDNVLDDVGLTAEEMANFITAIKKCDPTSLNPILTKLTPEQQATLFNTPLFNISTNGTKQVDLVCAMEFVLIDIQSENENEWSRLFRFMIRGLDPQQKFDLFNSYQEESPDLLDKTFFAHAAKYNLGVALSIMLEGLNRKQKWQLFTTTQGVNSGKSCAGLGAFALAARFLCDSALKVMLDELTTDERVKLITLTQSQPNSEYTAISCILLGEPTQVESRKETLALIFKELNQQQKWQILNTPLPNKHPHYGIPVFAYGLLIRKKEALSHFMFSTLDAEHRQKLASIPIEPSPFDGQTVSEYAKENGISIYVGNFAHSSGTLNKRKKSADQKPDDKPQKGEKLLKTTPDQPSIYYTGTSMGSSFWSSGASSSSSSSFPAGATLHPGTESISSMSSISMTPQEMFEKNLWDMHNNNVLIYKALLCEWVDLQAAAPHNNFTPPLMLQLTPNQAMTQSAQLVQWALSLKTRPKPDEKTRDLENVRFSNI